MIKKPSPGKDRLTVFRSWAREISETARWNKRWKGTNADINGQMARAMERAYQQGFEDAQTGHNALSNDVSFNADDPVAVPETHLSTRIAGVLHSIGILQIGGQLKPPMLDDTIRGFFQQGSRISDPRRTALDWQLFWFLNPEKADAFGDPISDRTIQLAVKAGLLESLVLPNSERNFLILSAKGRATYLKKYCN